MATMATWPLVKLILENLFLFFSFFRTFLRKQKRRGCEAVFAEQALLQRKALEGLRSRPLKREALDKNSIDLWPIFTGTPARRHKR